MSSNPIQVEHEVRRRTIGNILAVVGTLALVIVLVWNTVSAVNTGQQIQASRLHFCQDTNRRHDDTIAALDQILTKAVQEHPSRRAEIEASRASTVLLINALAPHRDCGKFLHVGG